VFVDTPREEAYGRWLLNNRTKERFLVHETDFNAVANDFEPPSASEEYVRYGSDDDAKVWMAAVLVPILEQLGAASVVASIRSADHPTSGHE